MNTTDALKILDLAEIPSSEAILNLCSQTANSHDFNQFSQAKETLLIENLKKDCESIGALIQNCGLNLEIRVLPPYIQTKLEFEEHKKNLVIVSFAAIKEQCMRILDELKHWDELKYNPHIVKTNEYFHFENHLPKLYQEYYAKKLKNPELDLGGLSAIKISLQNYQTYIINSLRNYCLHITAQFRQTKLVNINEIKSLEESVLKCKNIKEIGRLVLSFIAQENDYLVNIKAECQALEKEINGIHTSKPSHVFSPIIHWSNYKSLLLHEYKNQTIMQLFHMSKEFAKEEVSWMTFFNSMCEEIKKSSEVSKISFLYKYFKKTVLEYYEIKEWTRLQDFNPYLTSALNATFGLVPPNLRHLSFAWVKQQGIVDNILVNTILDTTIELCKDNLMKLPGIALYSVQIKKTADLNELSKIEILTHF